MMKETVKLENKTLIVTRPAVPSLSVSNHQLGQLFDSPQFSSFGHNVNVETIQLQTQKQSFKRPRVLGVFLIMLFRFVTVTPLETG